MKDIGRKPFYFVMLMSLSVILAAGYSQRGRLFNDADASVNSTLSPSSPAPAPAGQAMTSVFFDPTLVDIRSEATRRSATTVPASTSRELTKVVQAAEATPGKIALLSPYYDVASNPNNTPEAALFRARMVLNELAGLGLTESRIVIGEPVAVSGGVLQDAHRVEVRLQ